VVKIGLTLPNRGVLFGATTTEDMLTLAERADQAGFDSVWIGDSLFAKPRLETIALLGAIAGRTKNVRLGPACMASFPLRDPVWLAYQWASLDYISNGRAVLVGCTGIVPDHPGYDVEAKLFNVDNKDRVERLTEWIKILKTLWTEDNVTFVGKHYRFENVTIEPKPVAKPRPPIWIANNAQGDRALIERTHRRVALHADGWQTAISDPDDLAWRIEDIRKQTGEAGRDEGAVETHLYHNINVNEDQQAAIKESKEFLDIYYTADMPEKRVAQWTATGSPEQIVEHLKVYEALGFDEVTVRITSWNQQEQLTRVINEVLPHFSGSVRLGEREAVAAD
jgi:alkanesulfonate monooxygenase SsuD/methylene tetrahydromethanopterin reductase-like flavin-dependent oxidoreductase (luciferase family)